MSQTKDILVDGVWRNNVVFSQMLSLCPALAVTSAATQGLGMGLATLAVLIASNALVALLRGLITDEVRIPAFVLIIATLVTIVDLAMNAWLHELHKVLGLFIPLIVVNCLILGRAESFACKNSVALSALDGLAMGAGFTLALTLMGAVREIAGSGTLFSGAAMLLGPAMGALEVRIYPGDGALVMILPAGGFIVLGLMIAAKRTLDARKSAPRRQAATAANATSPVATAS
ncbi:MAG TPA: electron transport complex subunit E [Rhodoferax sp.]|nr:electron transport complex subunit E [Rhodoferax sp.]